MVVGFYLVLKSKLNDVDKQYLFDMIYRPEKYDDFVTFISIMYSKNIGSFREIID